MMQESGVKSMLTPVALLGPVPDEAVYSDVPTTVLMNLLNPFSVSG